MIQMVLSEAPIDEVPGKLTLATFFEDVRPLKGSTGLIDWRFNGRLSELALQGRIFGHFSESLLLPSQGRLASDEVLLFGLGQKKDFSEDQQEKGFILLSEKLSKLRASDFAVSFGDLAVDFMAWRALLRSFMRVVSERLGKKDLEVICAEDPRWIHEAKRRNMDFGPDVELTYT